MGRRKKEKFDSSKNRKLNEFLAELELEDDKKVKIVEYIENLTFQKLKEASVKSKSSKLRLKYSK